MKKICDKTCELQINKTEKKKENKNRVWIQTEIDLLTEPVNTVMIVLKESACLFCIFAASRQRVNNENN